jgi:glutamate/tyrosine decarboxylase-like PLP-dependent enzyme
VKFGYDAAHADGTFASGGAEANHTGMLCALVHAFPAFAREGLRALEAQPVFYISADGHHSFVKAARSCGLGTDAVRQVPTDENLKMDIGRLKSQIRHDRENGFAPFLVAATAGTTNSGAIDSLNEIADICAAERLWFHTDAAWSGAAALAPEWSDVLAGIERTDSITIDAHKWLSVPMGAGLFLTRHRDILSRTFHISTAYMPSSPGLDVIDPYTHSMQWSRRFIGLKLFLSLAVAGWDGYAAAIRHQIAMGTLLRHELAASGWKVVNDTPLPVACFIDNDQQSQWSAALAEEISRRVVSSGRAWISVTRAQGDLPVLRACITNYRTGPEDVRALVDALNATRATCSSVA